MATLSQQVQQQVLSDPRARDYNVPDSDRTYYEMLSDPNVGDLIKDDVSKSFIKTFIQPPIKEQELRAIGTDDPRYVPPEAPTGGLQPGEMVDEEGRISYRPYLEATQRQSITLNLGSLVGGKMTAGGTFLPGPPRPGTGPITFNLPEGMRQDEITADIWDKMLEFVRKEHPSEYQAAKKFEPALVSGAKSFGREFALAIPSIPDMGLLAARAVDYVVSPVGTNTLGQDIYQYGRSLFGLPDIRPRPSSPYLEKYPRIFESLGLYTTQFPNALYGPNVVIRPDRELMPLHYDTGKLLDDVLKNLGAPGALTPQQETEAQRMAAFFGGIFGGSLGVTGAARLAAKAVVKGLKLENIQDTTTLNRFLYSVANSPGANFAWGGKRRFSIPGGMLFIAKDQGIAGVAGTAMWMAPDEWGPTGKLMAGLTAPFTLGKARAAITAITKGQGLPIVSGFLEPFTASGQQRLAARYLAAIPGIKGNEQLIVSLISDLENVPLRPGQDALVSTPAYFNKVSDDLAEAEKNWLALRERGVTDADALAQLSQNPVYGRYFTNEIPVFGDRPPSIEALAEVKLGIKLVSDNMYGAMSWLQTGSPIKNEVLRAAGDRLRVAEEIFRDLSRSFDADPGAASAYVQKAVERLDELSADSLATHATDALLYIRLKELVGDPAILTQQRITSAERAVEGIQNAFREMREIERALWTNIGASNIEISTANMALIGDKAAEIILNTPVAQRNQIPALLFRIAGKNRLLSDEALEAMAKAAGATAETPAAIRTTRANLEALRARKRELEAAPYTSNALSSARRKIAELEARRNDPSFDALSDARKTAFEQQKAAALDTLSRLEGEATTNPALQRVDTDIAAQEARLASLEDQLIPKTTAGDEIIDAGPNGILDNVNTLDEVLAARSSLLDEASRARAKTGGANTHRIANEAQKYIVDEWLQNPEIFGDVGTTAAYDVARKFSSDLNTRYTRGAVADYLAVALDRGAKADHNQILAKIIKENEVGPNRLPSGSLDELDAALVEAKAPFLIRNEDGALIVDPDASLTPGLEDFTWESILTGGPGSEKLSAQLLREEILNRLALVAFDSTGRLNATIIEKSIRAWALPIAKIEESYPGFGSQLQELATSGGELATRHTILNNPTRATIDEALATQSLDDLAGIQDAGRISRRIQADDSVASVFLDNDPRVVAAKLLDNPQRFETDIAATLRILDADETGAARAGFQRAIFDELTRRTLKTPEAAGRMAGEAVLDPAQINQLLTENETALRQVFSDVIPGTNYTSYDLLKIFNDEISLGMAERAGVAAGAKAEAVALTFRGTEAIRNVGRILGVKVARWTGGPALVMAGAGGRLTTKIYESGGNRAVFNLVADALVDPYLAKLLLTETATLSKQGRFVFDKRLTEALRPYQFMVGPPTQVARESIEQQREIERLEREGGEQEIRYDPVEDIYRRERVSPQTSVQPDRLVASNMPPSRAPAPASLLSQVNPIGPRRPMGQASPETLAGLSQVGLPLFAAYGGYINGGAARGVGRRTESGIMSIGHKPRQIVG